MPETVIEAVTSPEAALGDVTKRLEAIERLLTLVHVGFCGIWLGEAPGSTSGEVQLRPGLLLLNGGELSQTEWPQLWAAWGKAHRYGTPADPANFKLPNLIDRMPWARAASGARGTVGATGGLDVVTLSSAQLPAHTHPTTGTVSVTVNAGATGISVKPAVGMPYNTAVETKALSGAGGGYTSPSIQNFTVTDPGHGHTASATHTLAGGNNTGGGGSHENLPPFTVVEAWAVVGGVKAV